VFSKVASHIFLGLHGFPAVFAFSAQPFLLMASIGQATVGGIGLLEQRAHALTSWLWRSPQLKEESIIDCILGQIAMLLNGLRDDLFAWLHRGYLLIFASARFMIIACVMSIGEIFDAVKIDKGGKLFQWVKDGFMREIRTDHG
jgi:hypothetical protein